MYKQFILLINFIHKNANKTQTIMQDLENWVNYYF